MSLSRKDKEALNRAIMRLAKIINNLEGSPVDPRVLDMLEICGSLLEQQIEMDIVFEQCELHDGNEVVLFEHMIDDDDEAEIIHIKFEDDDSDTPSSEDLENWFNLGE